MAFDGVVIRAIVNELSQTLTGGRIDKIYQPLSRELIFRIRTRGENHQLFMSADPTHPRIHLTKEKYINPDEPPMFCMLLRKHLEDSYIRSITQWNLERVVRIELESRNEIGDTITFWLIVEIMGRHSNILFVNPEKKLILDCVHHVNRQVNTFRELLPGREYILPPAQDKINPLQVAPATLSELIGKWHANTETNDFSKFFLMNFQGISPVISDELWARTNGNPTAIEDVFANFSKQLDQHEYQPCIVLQSQKYKDFSAIDLKASHANNEIKYYHSINSCIEEYYQIKSHQIFILREAQDLIQRVTSLYKRAKNKISKLEKSLSEASEAEHYKLLGELLTANLYQITKGNTQVEVINYYDPDQKPIIIPLDSALTPNGNAQNYFKKYNKQKNSIPKIYEQIGLAQLELQYFESILQQLESSELQNMTEIRQELIDEGYLVSKKVAKKKKKSQLSNEPLKLRSTTGLEIWVGRNNKQNDLLTTQIAGKLETWLHTKDIPGSHVVIRHSEYDEQTLMEAAIVAAYYSKAKGSSQVPVDYTLIRNVKKPSGSKPGYVIYEQQKTLYVTPQEEIVQRLTKS